MENLILGLIIGLIIGWITKSPFVLKTYKEWQRAKADHEAFCKRVIDRLDDNIKQGKGL